MDKFLNIKNSIFTVLGAIGGVIATALGGCSKLLTALLSAMAIDYISGLIVAVVFKNSPKTETGGAQSKAGFVGIVKKVFMLLIIVAVNQVDIVLGSGGFLRNAAITGFFANEILSMIENAGLMGIKLPPAVINAIDILKKKSEDKENEGA